MPRKATQPKSSEATAAPPVEEVKPVAEATTKEVKAKRTKKESTVVSKNTSAPAVSDVEENSSSSQQSSSSSSSTDEQKTRASPTRESVTEEFDVLVRVIDEEISRLRESQQKSKGIKFLRTLGKRVKVLRSHSARVMKQKHKTNRKNNTNSGILKPARISAEMAKFTGWKQEELRSRVDVTKYICKYIRDNNLQNPNDRRQITPDKALAKILDYSDTDKPLTYYRIQTYIKKHFSKPEGSPAADSK